MKKSLILSIAIIILTVRAHGQQQDSTQVQKTQTNDIKTVVNRNSMKYYIGLAAGFSTAYGPSFMLMKRKMALQIVFTPYKGDVLTQHSLGITPKMIFFRNENLDVFGYQGNHFFYSKEKKINKITNEVYLEDRSAIYNSLGSGLVFGPNAPAQMQLMAGFMSKNFFDNIGLTAEVAVFISLNKQDWDKK